jgi:hypothetical protein
MIVQKTIGILTIAGSLFAALCFLNAGLFANDAKLKVLIVTERFADD